VATGHYARVGHDGRGRAFVRRGSDAAKDQSYFLHGVGNAARLRTLFPLGELDKPAARALARGAGLPIADKPESQEICFLPDGDRAGFLSRHTTPRPGPIVHTDGRTLGAHAGIGGFTVGQRRGLGLGGGESLFVHRIEAATATVVVGDGAALATDRITLDRFWLDLDADAAGAGVPMAVQVRYRHVPVAIAAMTHGDGAARLQLHGIERSVAPGQAAVLYAGDAVVGGGRIVAATS
jgi:tRNA-specific 2-thiouridylase